MSETEYVIIVMKSNLELLKLDQVDNIIDFINKAESLMNIRNIQPMTPDRVLKQIQDNIDNINTDDEEIDLSEYEVWYFKSDDNSLNGKKYNISFEGDKYILNIIDKYHWM